MPEVILWECLRKGRLKGHQFRRQHPLGSYILDFYCPAARLAIEIDGEGHYHPDQQRHDSARDAWLGSKSVRVLRFPATSVLDNDALGGVLDEILAAVERLKSSPT